MAEPINIGGVLYEPLGNGQMKVVGYADAPAQGRVFTLPPSPKEARQAGRDAAADARAEEAARRAEEKAERERREWDATHNPDGSPKAGTATKTPSAKDIATWRANLGNISLLEERVKTLRDLYDKHFAGKGLQSIAESYAPTGLAPQYGVFEDTANQMLADMAKAKGLTAQQFNTPAEQRMFFEPLIPKRGDTDEQILNKLDYLERMIATGRQTTETNLGLTGDSGKPDDTPHQDQPRTEATDTGLLGMDGPDAREDYSSRLSAQVDAMINAGASKAMIDTVLKKQGFPTIRADDLARAKRWMKENPGKQYHGATITKPVALNLGQKLAGSALASAIARSADAATAGTLGAVTGEKGRGALDAMGAMHPNASLVGDIAGGITGAAGLEMAAARQAPAALARFAPRIADTLYGAGLGFNRAEEGEGLTGAGLGAGAGLAGGVLGQKLMSGAGRVARGVSDPAVSFLRDSGVPLTVGQALGNSGRFGRTVKNIEDALTSVPGVGSIVNARRLEGLEGFNEAAFRRAGDPIGAVPTQTGAGGIQDLRESVGRAYDDALGPVHIDPASPQFSADMGDVRAAAARVPDVNGARDAATTALDYRITGAIDPVTGLIPGRNFQEAYRGLARTGRERASGDYGHEVGQVMRQGQDVLASALEEQFPGAFGAFRAANSTNRNLNVLADAVGRAKNAEDELFLPSQLNMSDVASTRKLTGSLASAAGDRPFYELGQAGQSVLPSKLPDSGTATRGLVALGATGGLTGAGASSLLGGDPETGGGIGLGTMLLLAAGGSKPAQRAMTKVLLDRPDEFIRVGDRLIRNSGVGGWTGAGVLTPLLVGP